MNIKPTEDDYKRQHAATIAMKELANLLGLQQPDVLQPPKPLGTLSQQKVQGSV